MSKSTTASNSKPPRLPTKSAWARGPPPLTTSRSRSLAPSASTTPNAADFAVHRNHSRLPLTLGQEASTEEGVFVPRKSPTTADADHAGPPISSLAAAPVTEFGSIPVNGKAAQSITTSRPQAPSASTSTTPLTASTSAPTAPASMPSPAPKHNERDISKLLSPAPDPSTLNSSRLNAAADTFVPNRTISLKSADGKPVDLDSLLQTLNAGPSSVGATNMRSPGRPVMRMETPEQKRARMAAEGEKEQKKKVEGRVEREQEKANSKAKAAKEEEEEEEEGGGDVNVDVDVDGTVANAKIVQEDKEKSIRSASTTVAVMSRPGSPPLLRTLNQGGKGGNRRRTRSSRGHARSKNKQSTVQQQRSTMQSPLDPVAPLKATANRWTQATMKAGTNVEMDSPVIVEQKVNALLNNLTVGSFDSISDQIIGWANRSEKERDGRTLIQVIRLVFERAKDEENLSEMYARLCRKITDQISMKVQDDEVLDNEGKPFAGGQLARKYLLNRCQEDFENGWVAKESGKADGGEELGPYSDEYYVAADAKRRGLGLIRFIGELFKVQMITERVVHECIKKLLGNKNPEEEEIESLCKLLTIVGSMIDTPKARVYMDMYFARMKGLSKSENVNSRMAFMLQDIIELRSNGWSPRKGSASRTASKSSNIPDMLSGADIITKISVTP